MRQIAKGQIQIGKARIGNKVYQHRGVTVVQTGIRYTVWLDFVTVPWQQPWCDTLAEAANLINKHCAA